jgi:NAD-dependent SIR2 family protein deacetylase
VNGELGARWDELRRLVRASGSLLVLTGAGCSTESGIPDYRDADGGWKRSPPVQLREFLGDPAVRRRYWARSFAGWPLIAGARPNAAHAALARLERHGLVRQLITQNVDGLHQRAGSRRVLDLHGCLHDVECRDCGAVLPRCAFQSELAARNPDFAGRAAAPAPDGDADLADSAGFRVPDCGRCGGLLKPAVVFFGESVPRPRVERALAAVHDADALLVAGSSLMVWSAYRLVRLARERGLPVALVNLGRTRAEDLAAVRVRARCGAVLGALAEELAGA